MKVPKGEDWCEMTSCMDLLSSLFDVALGYTPFPYQKRLGEEDWPGVVEIPTGLGKTAAVILAWVEKRLRGDLHTPRRLVYVLPMRVLVEQVFVETTRWLERLEEEEILQRGRIGVYRLLGGHVDQDWDGAPEQESILIGTQDQLLSRALNRGYGMSRFRWPVHFGLLNNDCLWVMDEVQLMGAGLATTLQLEAFRRKDGTALPCRSVWMSATLNRKWLETVDFKEHLDEFDSFSLSEEDRAFPLVQQRMEACKILHRFEGKAEDVKGIAKFLVENHRPSSRSLIVLNRVERAQTIYEELKKLTAKTGGEEPTLCLLHSRFRPDDRKEALDKLLAEPGQSGTIGVVTQVVEAGVDISSELLLTDLAPWSSLIQRFGRNNRYGECENSRIFWMDPSTKKGWAAPYDEERLVQARQNLISLEGIEVGPSSLPKVEELLAEVSVLRYKDLYELFDTTADLSGFDVDVSRFIRESDDLSLSVFWRDLAEKTKPSDEMIQPRPEELCPAPLSDLRAWWKDRKEFWRWDHLDKNWKRPRALQPGDLLCLALQEGGYSSELGWTGNPHDRPQALTVAGGQPPEGDDDEPLVVLREAQSLAAHTDRVVSALEQIMGELDGTENHFGGELHRTLRKGARWHDSGKSHPVFQAILDHPEGLEEVILAKGRRGQTASFTRKGFRHELAAALAFLQNHSSDGGSSSEMDLTAYLIAAHHGKVRLSLRSLPHEGRPPLEDCRFARGIWEGDILPETDLGGGEILPETVLNLSLMELGLGPAGPSWTERMLVFSSIKKVPIMIL